MRCSRRASVSSRRRSMRWPGAPSGHARPAERAAQADIRRRRLGAAGVGVGRRVEVLALRGELLEEAVELGHATLRGADRHAVLTAGVPARLSGIQPILDRPGEQSVGNIPEVRILVLVRDAVSEVNGFGESRVKGVSELGHAVSPSSSRPSIDKTSGTRGRGLETLVGGAVYGRPAPARSLPAAGASARVAPHTSRAPRHKQPCAYWETGHGS